MSTCERRAFSSAGVDRCIALLGRVRIGHRLERLAGSAALSARLESILVSKFRRVDVGGVAFTGSLT